MKVYLPLPVVVHVPPPTAGTAHPAPHPIPAPAPHPIPAAAPAPAPELVWQPLLDAYKAFGALVGHFMLRKIASAHEDAKAIVAASASAAQVPLLLSLPGALPDPAPSPSAIKPLNTTFAHGRNTLPGPAPLPLPPPRPPPRLLPLAGGIPSCR